MTRPSQPPMPGPHHPHGPAPLVVAASVVGLEALLLALFGLAELRSLASTRATMGITTSLFFVAYGLGLGYCAWQLRRRESWTRAPIVLSQLIQLGLAWSFRGGGTTFAAIALAVMALLVLAGVFHPASIRALDDDDDPRGRQGDAP